MLLVVFVSVVSQDRHATQSYTRSMSPISSGWAPRPVASQLRAEIVDGLNSSTNGTSGAPLYLPLAETNAVPQRMVSGPARRSSP